MSASQLLHGSVPLTCGADQMSNLWPMASPQVNITHAPWVSCNGPWVSCNGPWARPNVQSLAHGPSWLSIISAPWAFCIYPWDSPNVWPLAHGPPLGNITYSPWVCFTSLQSSPNVQALSKVLPWWASDMPHGCVTLDHGADQMFRLWPIILPGSPTHLSHG
jgi:hypothetical protein